MRLTPDRMSVLLVDDHPLFCDALEMLCERHWPGMRVRSCGTLAQLKRMASQPLASSAISAVVRSFLALPATISSASISSMMARSISRSGQA